MVSTTGPKGQPSLVPRPSPHTQKRYAFLSRVWGKPWYEAGGTHSLHSDTVVNDLEYTESEMYSIAQFLQNTPIHIRFPWLMMTINAIRPRPFQACSLWKASVGSD